MTRESRSPRLVCRSVPGSPDAYPPHVTALSNPKTSLPWHLLVFPWVIVPCSALVSTVLLTGASATLGWPTIMAVVVPLGLHGGAVFAAWEGTRNNNERERLFLHRAIRIIAAVMALLGVLVAHKQFSDTPTLLLALALAFSSGPLALSGLLGVSLSLSKAAASQPEPEHPQR